MGFLAIVLVFVFAVVGVLLGTMLADVPKISRNVLAASGALLIAISVLGVLPEAAERSGWPLALCCLAAGFAVLWAIDRFVYPICSGCLHHHEHERYSDVRGFAGPLLIAAAVHSFVDGWGIGASQQGSTLFQVAFLLESRCISFRRGWPSAPSCVRG